MKIYGLQKLTLLDYPEKTACTVFTGGCNFLCPFCHNASLVTHLGEDYYTEEEIFDFLVKRKNMLDGVCVTGGEPLLQKDIESFIAKIKATGLAVKLDTNGSFPDKLQNLLDKKLIDYVAMDIKNCKDKYSATAGVNVDIGKIEQSVNILINSNIEYEFRTTVSKEYHTKTDLEKIGDWIYGAKKYYLQTYQPNTDTVGDALTPYPQEDMENFVKSLKNKVEYVSLRK